MVPYGIFLVFEVPTQNIPASASLSASESLPVRRGAGAWLLLPVTFLCIQSMSGWSTWRLFFSIIIAWPLPFIPSLPQRSSSACTPACFRNATAPGLPGDANDESAVAIEHLRVLQIRQLARRLLLHVVAGDAWLGIRHPLRLDLRRIVDRRIVGDGNRRESPPAAESERAATGALDDDGRLDEIRTRFGDEQPERTAGRVRHDDRRPDLVEQIRARLTPRQVLHVESRQPAADSLVAADLPRCSAPTPLAASTTGRTRSTGRSASSRRSRRLHDITATHARREPAEIVGADVARPGPLVVILLVLVRRVGRIRGRRREATGDALERERLRGKSAVQLGMNRRSSVPGTIDDVDLEAFRNEVLEPAGPAIRRAEPIGSLSAAAVHEHDRKRMTHLRGNHVLDVHLLPADERAARRLRALDVHPHVAPLGDVERNLRGRGCCLLRKDFSRRCKRAERRGGRTSNAHRGGSPHEVATADVTGREIFVQLFQLLLDWRLFCSLIKGSG